MTLTEKKEYLEKHLSSVPQNEIELFKKNFAHVYTRNSACMEGYEISLEDVISIVKGYNVKIEGTLARSIFNHYKAFQIVEARDPQEVLTEDFVKDLHECLLAGIIPGGLYRNVDLTIKGSNHIPCSYGKVYDRMGKYFYDVNHYQATNSNLEKVAYAHLQIAKIHPFLDGNGRLARLIMNQQLIALGYLPISIPIKRRKEYFDTLEEFKVNKTMEPFMFLLIDLLNKEYDRWIELIEAQKKNQ